ncbi:hypothetical protein HPB50_016276 [Hyalomma asiaticum]|uniref:Uncharacterized protein n=1 Tax=Hyalomma asiaticum TaxID=266040 RepID=A0ACB7SFB5_HYAAI|nr:hypothetical protein HPB50_016276 [Hyalomma asiaticum]
MQDGKYERLKMVFGFCKAPQAMQKAIRHTFNSTPCTAMYIDDVGQGASAVSESLKLLQEALHEVKLNGLKMDIRKCELIPP